MTAKTAARLATREALLDAALRLLFESPAADPIGALRPMDVVRAADPPRSNGAFYNIWPTVSDFRRDLLHHALSPARTEVGPATINAVVALLQAPRFSLEETIRVAANLNFEGLDHDPMLRLKHALWTRHADDPEVHGLLSALYDGITALLAPMYEAILARSGRRMRPPFTLVDLVTTLAALAEGLHTRRTVQPDAVPADAGAPPDAQASRDERWTFFASVAFSVFTVMTEPGAAG